MNYLIHDSNVALDRDALIQIMNKDRSKLTTNSDEFLKKNELGYYIIINTWLLIVHQYSEYGHMRLLDRIRREGLISVIKAAQDSSDEFIKTNVISDVTFSLIREDVDKYLHKQGPIAPSQGTIGNEARATILAILRYPKRFSPMEADVIQNESIIDFLNTENRTKLKQRVEPPIYVVNKARDEIAGMFDWDRVCDEIHHIISTHDYTLTTGVGYNSSRTSLSKVRAIAKTDPEFILEPFGIPYTGVRVTQERTHWYSNKGHDLGEFNPVRVMAVPKSYKAARIVAMEDTARQSVCRSIATVLAKSIERWGIAIPLRDQTINQQLAMSGSINGELATIDLSHASDCISKWLWRTIFPQRFVELVDPLLGTHTGIARSKGDKVETVLRVMQQMSTAGHTLTFILESIVFWAIAQAATHTVEYFTGNDMSKVSVYGDDIICDTNCFQTVVEFLEALGFITNESKSYSTGDFRESCGLDAIGGIDVTSVYFPRFPIQGAVNEKTGKVILSGVVTRDSFKDEYFDSLMSLISLQHRLFYVAYPASFFILRVIRSYKSVTASKPGSLNSDLWDYVETWKDGKAPMSEPTATMRAVPTEYWFRKLKSTPRVVFQAQKKDGSIMKYDDLSETDRRLLHSHTYREFLKYGSSSDDPIFNLLGIVDPPNSVETLFGSPIIKWGFSQSLDE